jgi:hypothetical protein
MYSSTFSSALFRSERSASRPGHFIPTPTVYDVGWVSGLVCITISCSCYESNPNYRLSSPQLIITKPNRNPLTDHDTLCSTAQKQSLWRQSRDWVTAIILRGEDRSAIMFCKPRGPKGGDRTRICFCPPPPKQRK